MTTMQAGAGPRPVISAEAELRRAFLAELFLIPEGQRLLLCQQCGTCTGSCPVARVMDVPPREMVARFRAGDLRGIVGSRSIWLCSSCYSCTTRCPVGIRLTDIVYSFKRLAVARRLIPQRLPVLALPAAFIGSVRRFGRNHEPSFMLGYYARTGPLGLLKQARTGLALFLKRRLPVIPKRIRAREELRGILRRAESIAPHAAGA